MKSIFAIVAAAFLFAPTPARADGGYGGYTVNGNAIYQRYSVSVPCSYCGRVYYRTEYRYREVTNSTKPDWRDTFLKVVNQIRSDEAFIKAASLIAPAQNYQPGYPGAGASAAAASAAAYPSVAGSSFGGFTSVERTSYGYSPLDVTRAQSEIAVNLDAFNRASADNARRGDEIHASVGTLIERNGERVAAIAEQQELRATVATMSQGMQAMYAGMAEAMRSVPRAAPTETFKFQQQQPTSQYQQGVQQQPPPPPTTPPLSAATPFPAPVGAAGGGSSLATFKQFCGKCHGAEAESPAGGWQVGSTIDPALWGALTLRLDPNSPEKTSDGKAFRMPVSSAPQPSVEERRAIVDELKSLVRVQ